MTLDLPPACPVCGGSEFCQAPVVWKELIGAWELSEEDVRLIDRQQGFRCISCGSNLRSMTVASAILREFDSPGSFREFVKKDQVAMRLSLIEFNEAGTLTPYLSQFRHYTFVRYPEVDMQAVPFSDEAFDIIVHSDTLEHIADPVRALRECRRLLSRTGWMFFTIPIVPTRLTRKRAGMPPSYHGSPGENAADHMVHTEYGADFFTDIVEAGFTRMALHTLGDLSSFCIVCRKA